MTGRGRFEAVCVLTDDVSLSGDDLGDPPLGRLPDVGDHTLGDLPTGCDVRGQRRVLLDEDHLGLGERVDGKLHGHNRQARGKEENVSSHAELTSLTRTPPRSIEPAERVDIENLRRTYLFPGWLSLEHDGL